MIDKLNVTFLDVNSATISCINKTLLQIDEKTFDLRCDVYTAMKKVYIEGDIVNSMCYIRISAGRNFALRQKSYQSSQYEHNEAKFAVDGYVQNYCLGQCSHTKENDQNPSWTVTFDQPYLIKRFVIYNRYDSVPDRLKKFDFEVYNQEGKTIFNYQDGNDVTQQVYTILYPNVDPVYEVTVSQRHKYYRDNVPIVIINEFEAYGECLDGTWGLGCKNTCDSSCNYSCSKADGTCNAVCIPYTNPPRCLIDCDTGKHGPNCALNCSDACLGQRCDSMNGHCLNCADGQYTPFCEVCPLGRFGANCSQECSIQCFESGKCDPVNGACYNGCKDGYTGSNCIDICPLGSYGANCSKECSDQCIESYKCDPVNGACYNGCKDGYTGSNSIHGNQSTNPHFSASILVYSNIGTCSATILTIVIVWYVWQRKLRGHRQIEIDVMYQKDELISDSSTYISENSNSKL